MWGPRSSCSIACSPGTGLTASRLKQVFERVAALAPTDDAQRTLKAEALSTVTKAAEMRLQLFVVGDNQIPTAFLLVLTSWMTVLFFGYGLLSPRNPTLVIALLVCALSVSGAIFLVLELSQPFVGVVQISRAPLQDALAHLGQ
jgi:hypothetical protein